MSAATAPMPSSAAPPTADEAKPRYRFVRDHGERAAQINVLFNEFTGRQRSLEAYRWEWFEGHPGPAFIWAILEPGTDRVVGHHGIVQTPLVVRGATVAAGRTENTIIYPEVRKKIFYPGMEKKAFTEVLASLALLYTVHNSGAQGKIRERLGYRPVGRWAVFLPVVRAGYLMPLLERVRARLAPWAPKWSVGLLAGGADRGLSIGRRFRRPPGDVTAERVDDVDSLRAEYEPMWSSARGAYDVTIDRSWEFLSWRVFRNPNLRFEVWALRRAGTLIGVIIGHRHHLGSSYSLYVDDIICRGYDDRDFGAAVRWLPFLMPDADAVVVMTLDVDTPLRRALAAAHRVQNALLARLGVKLFDELVAYDRDAIVAGARWYVTPIFTEGLDTSR